MGPGGLATPETGVRLCPPPPNKPTAASGPGGRWGSDLVWSLDGAPFAHTRVVFVIGCVSCKKYILELTSGKNIA
jgi:hypothetical protein